MKYMLWMAFLLSSCCTPRVGLTDSDIDMARSYCDYAGRGLESVTISRQGIIFTCKYIPGEYYIPSRY